MRPDLVALPAPGFDAYLRVFEGEDSRTVEAFVSELPAYRFGLAVLPGAARRNAGRLHSQWCEPLPDGCRRGTLGPSRHQLGHPPDRPRRQRSVRRQAASGLEVGSPYGIPTRRPQTIRGIARFTSSRWGPGPATSAATLGGQGRSALQPLESRENELLQRLPELSRLRPPPACSSSCCSSSPPRASPYSSPGRYRSAGRLGMHARHRCRSDSARKAARALLSHRGRFAFVTDLCGQVDRRDWLALRSPAASLT